MKVKDCMARLEKMSPEEEIIMGVFTYQEFSSVPEQAEENFSWVYGPGGPFKKSDWETLVGRNEDGPFLWDAVWEGLYYNADDILAWKKSREEEVLTALTDLLSSDLTKEEAR